jgi:hypothetical protein
MSAATSNGNSRKENLTVTTTTSRSAGRNVTVSQGNSARVMQQAAAAAQSAIAQKVTAEDVKAMYEAKLQAALDEAMARAPGAEVAELQGWWDLVTIGPIQVPHINGPYLPSDVIRSGEPAFVVTILLLNPFLVLNNQITACELLSTLALPYEITYQTGNLTKWQPASAPLTSEHDNLSLVPHQCFYVDVLEFIPNDRDEVMYEMNISARIFGCGHNYAPPLAGFAREVVDIDPSFFTPPPGLVGAPIRFLVYGDQPDEL